MEYTPNIKPIILKQNHKFKIMGYYQKIKTPRTQKILDKLDIKEV